jgi:hypothetical protein
MGAVGSYFMRVILALCVVAVSCLYSVTPALALIGLSSIVTPGQEPIAYHAGSFGRRAVYDCSYHRFPAVHRPGTFSDAEVESGHGDCTPEAAPIPRALVSIDLPYKLGTVMLAAEVRRLL